MKKLLTRNLGLKLASLVLAFVLWFLVAQIYDPKDTVTFNNIQVRLLTQICWSKKEKYMRCWTTVIW